MSRYERGSYFERQVKRWFEKRGWYVIRSAGSHGVADLVALHTGSIQLIQCKVNGKMSKREKDALKDAAAWVGGTPMLAWRPKRGEIGLEDVTYAEAKDD